MFCICSRLLIQLSVVRILGISIGRYFKIVQRRILWPDSIELIKFYTHSNILWLVKTHQRKSFKKHQALILFRDLTYSMTVKLNVRVKRDLCENSLIFHSLQSRDVNTLVSQRFKYE